MQEIVSSNHAVEQMKERLVISLFSSYQSLFDLPYKYMEIDMLYVTFLHCVCVFTCSSQIKIIFS